MKYLFFVILAFLLVSCNDGKSFEIKGKVANESLNGKYIYLQKLSGNHLITLDSVLVKEEKFKFKGNIKESHFSELSFNKSDSLNFAPAVFILEKGKMEAYIDTFSYVRGGEVNNNLAEYYAQSFYYEQKLRYLQHQQKQEEYRNNDSLRLAIEDWQKLYHREIVSLALHFVEMNNDNLGGVLVFLQNVSFFTKEEVRNILFYAGPVFKNNKGVKVLEEILGNDSIRKPDISLD